MPTRSAPSRKRGRRQTPHPTPRNRITPMKSREIAMHQTRAEPRTAPAVVAGPIRGQKPDGHCGGVAGDAGDAARHATWSRGVQSVRAARQVGQRAKESAGLGQSWCCCAGEVSMRICISPGPARLEPLRDCACTHPRRDGLRRRLSPHPLSLSPLFIYKASA